MEGLPSFKCSSRDAKPENSPKDPLSPIRSVLDRVLLDRSSIKYKDYTNTP